MTDALAAGEDRPALDRAALDALLAGGPWRVELVPSLPSTNAAAAERVRAGEPAGLVLVTEHQTAGRGRLDRVWVTPPRAALTFSVVLAPRVPAARWPWLPLLVGVAVVEGVRRTSGVDCVLKWPNDVLVADPADPAEHGPGGAKVAGILVERVERPDRPVAVVGVGLNVSATAEELPVSTATSLALAGATGAGLDRAALLAGILARLEHHHARWSAAPDEAGLRASYQRLCATLGRRVRVELPSGEPLTGRAVDLDETGRLRVLRDAPPGGAATEVLLGAGDVVHVRPGTPPAAGPA